MNKLLLLVGAGVGYVLGARAGRERFDQIADQANKLWSDPRVQTKVEDVKAKAPQVASQVKAKVTGSTGTDSSSGSDTGTGSSFDTSSSSSFGTDTPSSYTSDTGSSYSTDLGSTFGTEGTTTGTGSSFGSTGSDDSSDFGPGGDRLP